MVSIHGARIIAADAHRAVSRAVCGPRLITMGDSKTETTTSVYRAELYRPHVPYSAVVAIHWLPNKINTTLK